MRRHESAHATASEAVERKETGRVEAFSDGVFSIAITLLVFTLAVPTVNDLGHGESLATYLGAHATQFATYVLSFVTILVMWINHHSVFAFVFRIDRLFLFLNGLLLMMIVFINYPTTLAANFIGEGHGAAPDAKVAAGFLSATFVLISVLFNLLWHRIADDRRLVGARVSQKAIDALSAQYRFGPLVYVPALGLAFVNAWASLALNAALAIYFAFTGQLTTPVEDASGAVLVENPE